MKDIPFLDRAADLPVAIRGGQSISTAEFAGDVAALAERLPARRYVLNHCEDRYHFLVGLAATLSRSQVSLFPSSRAPEALSQLALDYPDSYCLTDQAESEFVPTARYETAGHGAKAIELPVLPSGQLAAIFFTSGSTGVPQPHSKTWGTFVQEADLAGRALGLSRVHGGSIVATVPPQHMYGFTMSIMLPLRFGCSLVAERPFFPEDVSNTLRRCKGPLILVTTPLQLRACVLEKPALPPLDFILSSTAPLDGEIARAAEVTFGTQVLEIYGSTETGAIASRRQQLGPRWQAFETVEMRADAFGLQIEASYLPKRVILGDRVELHSGGQFTLIGRSTDLVKIAGKRISLSELNRHLLAVPGVVDGVYFCPDSSAGREPRLTAFVVAPGKSREDILSALLERVDPVFLPRPLRLVEALPRNTTGKLPRGSLVHLWEEEMQKEISAN